MNERIKQLADQCEDFGDWDHKVYTFDKEKFAKLIIRECAEVNIAMLLVGLILILDTGIKIAEMTLNEILELKNE